MKKRLAIAGFVLALAAPAGGQRPALAMLDNLDSGRWELRVRDGASGVERICLRDGRGLIQLRHPALNCQRLVVSDAETQVTVQYTCRGRGFGRTQIRRESSRLVQIDTQGIADGVPFAFAAEARRVSDCAG